MAGNLGKLFRFGGKKPTKKPTTDTAGSNTSDEDEGYVDPTESCSTQPPGLAGTRQLIPNYPPPRPATSSSPLSTKKLTLKKEEYQDPWDSKESNEQIKSPSKLNDTYEDPFDAMKVPTLKNGNQDIDDLADLKTTKTIKNVKSFDEESMEFKSKSLNSSDAYEDPWDTRSNKPSSKNDPQKSSTLNNVNTKKKDDYSDPWDSKKLSISKCFDEYDDTYSEPYDKNKQTVMDSAKHHSTSDEEDGEVYDMPYEERVIIGVEPKLKNGNLKNSSPQPAPNTSAVPKKPASASIATAKSDYDAPWEWKVKNLEADFEKRFSIGVDTAPVLKSTLSTSQPPKKPVPAARNSSIAVPNTVSVANPVQKPARSTANKDVVAIPKTEEPPHLSKDYEIDPTIPLKNQGWFHGALRRDEAEALLKSMPDCSYLIRDSESSKLNYSLSIRNKGETMHLKISCQNGKYILGMNSKPYDTIPEMIHYYSMNKLNIRGAEHVKLIYPVLQEALYFTVEPGS